MGSLAASLPSWCSLTRLVSGLLVVGAVHVRCWNTCPDSQSWRQQCSDQAQQGTRHDDQTGESSTLTCLNNTSPFCSESRASRTSARLTPGLAETVLQYKLIHREDITSLGPTVLWGKMLQVVTRCCGCISGSSFWYT